MTDTSSFRLQNRNPDILSCIANLSNDEVFTPPELANKMLDTLADTWAKDHDGESIWANKSIRFLDPCTKSGVFLREITARLIDGLADEFPDLQKRVNHILTYQVFGIGITQLTSLLSRRSLYCSKSANGKHSVMSNPESESGNIWYKRIEHTWKGKKCDHCGAQKTVLDRGDELENYAYAFIHTNDIKSRIAEFFGGKMHFDVIIGNPPYQMKGGAGGSSDSSIYHLFVEQALQLDPQYLSMVIPSRWLAGGRGLDEFRSNMLGSYGIVKLVDYPVSKDVFPNVEVKGGVCYFLQSKAHDGKCEVTSIRGDEELTSARHLDQFDVFVRDPRAIGILEKVLKQEFVGMNSLVSNREPFKFESNYKGSRATKKRGDIKIYRVTSGSRQVEWVPREEIQKNIDLIDRFKVLDPKAGSDGGQKIPDSVLGKPWLAPPPSVCTGSFLAIWANSAEEANSVQSYYCTKFFRFLVSLRKITQDAFSHMYRWVPIQSWDTEWTDQKLYEMYNLTSQEIDYIESVIRPMEIPETAKNE